MRVISLLQEKNSNIDLDMVKMSSFLINKNWVEIVQGHMSLDLIVSVVR